MPTEVDIANMALRKFGAGTIVSFNDQTPSGRAVQQLYGETIRGLLSEYPWSFVKQTVKLAALALTPDASGYLPQGWRYGFALPAGTLAAPDKYLADPNRADNPLRAFEVQGQQLFCNAQSVWAVADIEPDPRGGWPAYFITAAVACLAYELVMPITSNASIRDSLKQEAVGSPAEGRRGGKLGLAKLADARKQASVSIAQGNPIMLARFS